jgi:hypothetical protein
MRLIAALKTAVRSRLSDESGFVMVLVMLLLMIGSLFAISAWTSANGDVPQTRQDYNRKQAYNAAEAGVNYYVSHLNQDDSYWTNCDVPNTPIMQPWDGSSARPWRRVPNDESQYVVAFTKPCDTNNPSSVLDSGVLRMRSTGRLRGSLRTIDVTFRRNGFLDYLYFTNFETQDPISFSRSDPTYASWAAQNCLTYRWAGRSPLCKSIVFADRDVLQGPFHTNDNIAVCGSPKLGRPASADRVEMGGAPPFVPGGTCVGTPQFSSTPDSNAPNLGVPTSNTQLAQVADPAYTFVGKKFITLSASTDTITVADSATGANAKTMPWPANGVIYGTTGSNPGDCTYDMQQKYDNSAACADLYVKGTFRRGLTITSDNDVIVNGPLTKSGNGILGLIATKFVRVYHPVNRGGAGCSNAAGSLGSVEIDAAILSLRHSFIVDNYDCGTTQGTLTVKGAIAQNFRGPVGTGGTTIATGYQKNYLYDDRFASQNPPYFLDPIDSKWRVVRFNEEVCDTTAATCPNKP